MAKYWTTQELEEVLTKASPHVRYLLWELYVKEGEVARDQLESRPVALAIVQRLSSSKGKDSLVLSVNNGDGVRYKLNPDYLEDFNNLLSKEMAPEKPKERPKEKKPRRGALVSTRDPDNTGAAAAVSPKAEKRTRGRSRKSKSGAMNELVLPLTEDTDFQFWFEFIRTINAKAGIDLTILSNGQSALLKIP